MEIRCPRCAHPLIVPGDTDGDDDSEALTLQDVKSIHCPNCGSVSIESEVAETATLELSPDKESKRIGHFSLSRMLGKGAFGVVWLARDITLGRDVALKLPSTDDPEAVDLLREAQTAASLRHPNIVSIYEVGHANGRRYIASEFIDGLTLRDFLSVGRPGIPRTVELLRDVAEALHHAHEHKVIHRDVKPANILLSKQGDPYIADFGIAKRISADATISTDGQVIGTAKYMSPEQADGKPNETDRRSDVYALGVVLFEMLTGETPFRGNVRALLHQKVHEEAPSPRKLDPSIPKDLETICLKCIEREPAKRYQTALSVAEELNRFRVGEPIQARPISKLERFWRRCRQRPVVASLVLGLFLSLTIGLLGVSYFWLDAKASAERTLQALYRSQMNLAANYLDNGDVSGVRRALDRFDTGTPGSRFRGFEWYYFANAIAPIVEVVNQGEVVEDLALSRNGNLCAASGKDKPTQIWETQTGRLVRTLPFVRGRLRGLDFSPVRDQLAVGSHDGKVRIWNATKEGPPVHEIPHGPPVNIVRYSADGTKLLSGGIARGVRVWNTADGSSIKEFPSSPEGLNDARFSPDGKQVAIASAGGVIRLWEIESRRTIATFSPNPAIESLAFSDDGKSIVAGCWNGQIQIWSVEKQSLEFTHEVFSRVGAIEFLKDSRILAIVSTNRNLYFYDIDQHREVKKLNTHYLSPGVLARSADGKYIAVGSGDGTVKRVPIPEILKPRVLWQNGDVRQLAFLPDGNQLISTGGDGALNWWDLASEKSEELVAATERPVSSVSVDPQGKWFAAAGANTPLQVWEVNGKRRIKLADESDAGVTALAVSHGGQYLCAARSQGPLVMYQSDNWRSRRMKIADQKASVVEMEFSPDDRSIAVGFLDSSVRFFDVATGGEDRHSFQVKSELTTLCYCNQGQLLAIGTDSGDIHLYSPDSNQIHYVLKGHSGRISALAAMPGSSTLVSGGRDGDVRLWDAAAGEPITTLTGHFRQVFSLAVSPQGNSIASGGLLGDIRLWRHDANTARSTPAQEKDY